MNKKIRRIFLSFISCSLIFSVFSQSVLAAKSVSDLKKQMQERNAEIEKAEKEISSKKAEKDVELEKRNKLDREISAMLDDISDVQDLIDEKEREIQEKNEQIETITQQIDDNNERLKNRLKVMYEYGPSSYIQLLLDSQGLGDLLTRISIVKSVYSYDKDVIEQYIESRKTVEEAKQVVVNEQKEQLEAKSILEDKKKDLEKLKNEKQEIIDSLNSDIKALEKQEQQMEDDYASMKRELDAALSAQKKAQETKKSSSNSSSGSTEPAYSGNGRLGWPSAASTNITSPFGYRIHPISGSRRLHRGIDIGAPLGSNVLAAEAGTVVTAGWNNSYGYYVTINHGGGLVTLYAHNSKLLVSAGQSVSKGQVISKCGSTGNSTGPHIHFEVMINGVLKNPLDYL